MRRFVTGPNYGDELNKDNAGEVLKDFLKGISDGNKYPICIMFPPVELPNFDTNWSKYRCRLLFLTPQYNDVNGTQNRNPFNNLSQHTTEQIWKDMGVCAKDFRRFLNMLIEKFPEAGLRECTSIDMIERFSGVGNDNLAGVGLTFELDLSISCDIEDYSVDDINNFTINTNELHPHHEH
ncbi:hypothetical protein C1637_09915 [Chryseobacterium lactis]|uniref:Uncharacterized protein n=2 Tax=Chryseobacterium lactis TaxID=1241981 RepID=A0A3G6RCQ6_CHRLC|nr:hypothetical protein EG342_09785 [Chryseobacterium lactis]AZB02555.1 hypothetical protein EG341_00640 [Chryseobacterium lactis]PNW14150.1 hypothetical protein C1637_09915 [Chryseobacterium lactis]